MSTDGNSIALRLRELGEHAHAAVVEEATSKVDRGQTLDRIDVAALDRAASQLKALYSDAAAGIGVDLLAFVEENKPK